MKKLIIFIVVFLFASSDAIAGCMEPYGEYRPKEGETKFIIDEQQIVKLYNSSGLVYEGSFTNFDEVKGTEYHNYENAIFIKPNNSEQSYVAFHISDDCKLIKAFIHRIFLERFGGEPPILDAKVYFKND